MGTIEQGARNAVETCMGLRTGERVLIVSDRAEAAVGEALSKSAASVTGSANVNLLFLEDLSSRPLTALPGTISNTIPVSDVTFWAAQSLPGELVARRAFLTLAKRYARHGHMPNVTPILMEQGMCSDYNRVFELTHAVYERVRDAKKITVSNRLGSELEVQFDQNWRWVPSDGRYHEKGRWGNLPEGETFTAPKKVRGRLVTNLLGDWFSDKYGNFSESLSFDVEDSLIKLDSVSCQNATLRKDFLTYLSTDPNSVRAGEFALPTNPELILMPTIGNLLQDEKARVHIAFGDPYQDETGAPWSCPTHVDMLLEGCNVEVDGTKIMRDGSYVA